MRFLPFLLAVLACVPNAPPSLPSAAYEQAVARLREVDSNRPYVDAGYIYYSRADDDGVRAHFRRALANGSREEKLFRDDELSSPWLGALQVSPDARWLAISAESARDRWKLVLKDLQTGEMTTEIDGTDFSLAWDEDNTLYFAQLDADNTPRTVYAMKPKEAPRPVHRERQREVMVAPVEDKAALFIRGSEGVEGHALGSGVSTPSKRCES